MKVKSESKVTQLCLTLSDSMDCSLPGSSVHGIFQARVLEWVAIAFSGNILCCCCCWVTSVMSNSVWPHRWQPTRLHHPWDSPGENTGVGCHFLLQCMKVKSESEVAQSCPLLVSKIYKGRPTLAKPWGILLIPHWGTHTLWLLPAQLAVMLPSFHDHLPLG